MTNVSVAMCTHNGAEFVDAQLKSISDQTMKVTEIVLSDDASVDETLEIVEQVNSALGLNLRIVKNNPAMGVVKNFQFAIGRCSGPLIALCDQDDVWLPNKVERLHALFEQDKSVEYIFTNAQNIDALGQPMAHSLFEALELSRRERALISEGRAFEALLRRNLATGATVVFRKSLYARATPFPANWLHDEWLAIVAAANGSLRMLDEPLTAYRQHSSNQIGMRKLTFLQKFGKFSESRTARLTWLLRHAEELDNYMSQAPDVPEVWRRLAREKYEFESRRQTYPARRFSRLKPISQEIVNGSYTKFATGFKDAIRDLVQPV